MYSSLFDAVFVDSFFSPMRTVYVVSDSQLEEIKRNQRDEELENIETSRKRLEESYQARVKVLDEREHELQEEIKALAPSKKEKEKIMNDEELRSQINQLIRGEIQESINQYVDDKEEGEKGGLGFVKKEDEEELKVKVSNDEVDRLIKEYKKIKKNRKSNFGQIKKLSLLDKNGNPL